MAIVLEDLLCGISKAICNANSHMEETALQQYMSQGYKEPDANRDDASYSPLTFDVALRQGEQARHIPISALMHNTTMRLEQVDMKLKFKMYEQNGKIMVDCMPNHMADATLDEMTLQFKNSVSTEGIYKISDAHMKNI